YKYLFVFYGNLGRHLAIPMAEKEIQMSRYFFYTMIMFLFFIGTNSLHAQIPVSGVVSGTWSQGNTYEVVGDLYILSATTLTIEPGVVVKFTGYYRFYIYGRLLAKGTATDSIYFTCDPIQNPNKWGGIRFSNADSLSSMSYCVVENGWAKNPEPNGGGVYCSYSSPTFSNCTFINNRADNDGGGIAIFDSKSPKINYCTFKKNSASSLGGGIRIGSQSSPTFTSCIIDSNSAPSGGGLGAWNSTFKFENCQFIANYASTDDGGGIASYNCSVILYSCVITKNSVSGGYGDQGAGINAENSTLTIFDCIITYNYNASGAGGGGIMAYQTSINISGSTISNNSANWGGGLYLENSCDGNYITNSKISYNSAAYEGGGIVLRNSCFSLTNSELRYNTAIRGGGMQLNRYWASIKNCTFSNNSAPSQNEGDGGGGIYVTGGARIDLTDCLFKDNTAARGGGIYGYSWSSSSTIDKCTFKNNSTDPFGGGGIYNSNASLNISECLFDSNKSVGYGGGINNYNASPSISQCVFNDNHSGSFGGAIYNGGGGSPKINRCTMYGNSASSGGGIAISDCSPIINSTIVDSSSGIGIYFGTGSSNTVVKYSDFFNNIPINFGGSDVPPGLGIITTTNYNGDPCDNSKNIFLDPLFVNARNGDFHLQYGSPCINAGDPQLGNDSLGTYFEIGRYDYFPPVGVEQSSVDIPETFSLFQNYPNPFNPSTMIHFELPKESYVTIKVYNMLGQEVIKLVDEEKPAGRYDVHLDGTALPSGVYFYRLLAREPSLRSQKGQAGQGFIAVKKFVLLK
ncbi:MAG: right-handed parallel beta-helix repeat-containing protein, partial [Bacteroidota bacterium]|nr:right-handed parallel beta-helix repeat-containing protein [Bacteroidota bacterium]